MGDFAFGGLAYARCGGPLSCNEAILAFLVRPFCGFFLGFLLGTARLILLFESIRLLGPTLLELALGLGLALHFFGDASLVLHGRPLLHLFGNAFVVFL